MFWAGPHPHRCRSRHPEGFRPNGPHGDPGEGPVEVRCQAGQSLTAPPVVFMIRFWNTKNMIATGMVIKVAAASLIGN